MNTKERKEVNRIIDSEGFDYTFQHYSDFEHVKDLKFHELRTAYLAAAKELSKYIGHDVWECDL